jgi:hypothetical protein
MAFDAWSPKDPSDTLDYTIDWTALLVGGETITAAVWSVLPSSLSIGTKSIASPNTSAWLSGGTPNTQYAVTCKITTSAGRSYERTVLIDVENL